MESYGLDLGVPPSDLPVILGRLKKRGAALLACPLALFALLAAAALRGRLGALTLQRVALLAAVLNVCGLLSLVERVFHL